MPIPEFIRTLRTRIGHDLLWLPGLSAVVLREDGSILLGKRSDNGLWAVISGIPEPGEEPVPALEREITEETGVVARVRALASIRATPVITHGNGDIAQYLNLNFVADYISGTARVGDDESEAVGWFRPQDLPEPLAESTIERLADARAFLDHPDDGPLLAR
ncbi:NUDIX hydrolase [Pseudactinotalea sp. Z1739]|uniref:NUDIX hydrolase n=1 Tax=Pseudactinotalea sp. Z1739 TaxID=3413028 RepID=UPI003C7A5D94